MDCLKRNVLKMHKYGMKKQTILTNKMLESQATDACNRYKKDDVCQSDEILEITKKDEVISRSIPETIYSRR